MLSDWLSQIWVERDNGQIKKIFDRFEQKSIEIQYPAHSNLQDKLQFLAKQPRSEWQHVVDFILLDLSFKRSKLHCNQVLTDVLLFKDFLLKNNFKLHAFFHRQMGLFYLAVGEFSLATEEFMTSLSANPNEREQVFALINLIICLESQSYDYEKYLLEFEQKFYSYLGKQEYLSVQEQYFALKLRYLFFVKADIQKFKNFVQKNKLSGQARYFSDWVFSLPQFSVQINIADYLNEYISYGKEWLTGYRLRTFQEVIVGEDFNLDIKLTAHIERLYLWVWLWLVDPQPQRLEKIKKVLHAIYNDSEKQITTFENFQLLENSLLWLSFFQTVGEGWNTDILNCLSTPIGKATQFLQQEKRFIMQIQSVKSAQTTPFKFLNEGELFRTLNHSIQDMIEKRKIFAGIHIDYNYFRVSLFENNRAIRAVVSESLCRLFYLFTSYRQFKCDYVFKFCFNFSHFSDELHLNKLANLISRANQFLKDFGKFSIKSGVVSFTSNLETIYQGCCEHSFQMNHFDFNHATEKNNKLLILKNKWFKRQEIEKVLSLSKSTMNRKIDEWVKQNLMQKRGQGKNIEYYLTSEFEKLI